MGDSAPVDQSSPSLVPLPFGIPVLDRLLGLEGASDPLEMRRQLKGKTSITVLGEDGTGKSVFALHLASAYQALTQYAMLAPTKDGEKPGGYPTVLYVSSDLPFAAAEKTWRDFYLDHPWLRYIPSVVGPELENRQKALPSAPAARDPKDYFVELRRLTPQATADKSGTMSIASYMSELDDRSDQPHAVVGFLDLCDQTSGDDWLLVSRIIATAQERKVEEMPNLLILDSVAGFEALVGETNSFGEAMTRRARLAQLFRAAGNNWNIVLVSEEPDRARHHQEEYISDTVVHLYRRLEDRTVRRWFEIEKSRAHSFALGPHVFEIRDGKGSSTGSWENPDDPRANTNADAAEIVRSNSGDRPARPVYNAYVEVFPNLEYLSNEFARRPQPLEPQKSNGVEPFRIKNLDDMLDAAEAASSESTPTGTSTEPRDFGLKHGTVTAIVGDEGTRKAAVAEQFLLRAFDDVPALICRTYQLVRAYRSTRPEEGFVAFADKDLKAPRAHGGPAFPPTAPSAVDTINQIARAKAGVYRLKVGGPTAPLMSRWDLALYYDDSQAEDPTFEAETMLVATLAYLRSSPGLMHPAVFICTHDASADDVSEWIFEESESKLRDLDEPSFAVARTLRTYVPQKREEDANGRRLVGGHTAQEPVQIDVFKRHICRLIERSLVVRRLELQDASASKLWNIVQSCVERALHLQGHAMADIHAATGPLPRAGAIRVVITDWRTIRDTYPSVKEDPLFLPTLLFRLRRSGVTTLLVDSESGQPDQPVSDPLSRALRNNADRQIYTWKVPFFGEQRVALTVLPPGNERTSSVIRELSYERSKISGRKRPGRVYVDRHFELYSDLERGMPTTVPLKVLVYAETPAFRIYAESENAVLSRLFEPPKPESGGVVELLSTDEYDALHDYCHLSVRRRLPYSLVFMVDGFWGLGQNVALRREGSYLYDQIGDVRVSAVDASDDDDHFGLFKPTALGLNKGLNRRSYFRHKIAVTPDKSYSYETRLPDDRTVSADRVPFSWDFGFLLCDRAAWLRAKDVALSAASVHRPLMDPDPKALPHKVQSVWKALRAYDGKGEDGPLVSWRAFLEAATKVAKSEENRRGVHVRPFDVAATSAEVFSCLLLEIWLSEALNDIEAMRDLAGRLDESDASLKKAATDWVQYWSHQVAGMSLRQYSTKGVRVGEVWLQTLLGFVRTKGYPKFEDVRAAIDICRGDSNRHRAAVRLLLAMPGLSFQLYKAWLLLLEAVAFEEHIDERPGFDLRRDKVPSPDAVAVRHWYKTACDANKSLSGPAGADTSQMVPMALPGRFTTRGDWFLGASAGSRSDLLVDQALDFFSSRRANRRRLQLGLGLPTRDIVEPDSQTRIRTALKVFSRGTVEHVTYDQIFGLGGRVLENRSVDDGQGLDGCSRRWLFRTGIMDYDRQSAAIRRWVHRLFSYTPTYRTLNWHEWEGGFKAYDAFTVGDFSKLTDYRSFHDFIVSIRSFVSDLNNCTTFAPVREPEIGTVPPLSSGVADSDAS